MKRAIIYARVSDRKQAERDLPVESQIEACTRKAAEMGAAVLKVYRDDGISGRTDDRQGFQDAIEHAVVQGVEYLVVWDSSRFARDQYVALLHKRRLEEAGVRLIYAAMSIDRSTEEGWLADSFQQIIDEAKSRATSRDTKRSMVMAARDGYWMGGREPYGYNAVPAPGGKRRRLQPVPEEAETVRFIYGRAARGIGAFSIAVMLNEQGTSLRGRPWNKNTVLGILKSEVYMGEVIYNRFDRRLKRAKPQDEWVRVQAHEAIITPEAFAAVREGLDRRAPEPSKAPGNAERPFAGLLTCACGHGMKVTSGTGRGGRAYYYYACNASVQGRPCGRKRLPADKFDAWLMVSLLDAILSTENMMSVLEQMQASAAGWQRERAERRTALVKELRDAERRRGNLFAVLEAGDGSPGIKDIAPRLRELNEQINRLDMSLQRLEDEPAPEQTPLGLDPERAALAMRAIIGNAVDAKAVRAFIASIVARISVGDEVVIEYHPECLIRASGGAVHSSRNWLPDLGSNQGPTD